MPLTKNKDEAGDFTDHAIEVIEAENKRLAELIGVPLEGFNGFNEAVADATFRLDFDYLEPEILMVRKVAWGILVRRARGLARNLISRKKAIKVWTAATFAVVIEAFIFFGATFYRLFLGRPSEPYMIVATIYSILFVGCLLAGIVMTSAHQYLFMLAEKNLKILQELNEEDKELHAEFSRKLKETKEYVDPQKFHFMEV